MSDQSDTPRIEVIDIALNAVAANIGLRCDIDLIRLGLTGLEVYSSATIEQCCDRIISDYLNGKLEERLTPQAPNEPRSRK